MNMMGYELKGNAFVYRGAAATDGQIAECEAEIGRARAYLSERYDLDKDDPVGDLRGKSLKCLVGGDIIRDYYMGQLEQAQRQLATLKAVPEAWQVAGVLNHARAAQGHPYKYE